MERITAAIRHDVEEVAAIGVKAVNKLQSEINELQSDPIVPDDSEMQELVDLSIDLTDHFN